MVKIVGVRTRHSVNTQSNHWNPAGPDVPRRRGVPYPGWPSGAGDESDRVSFVGTAIGYIVAHEAGHYLGGWHTDPGNEQVNLMDSGGDLEGMFAVGPDGVGGTEDDLDADFEVDAYDPFEGFPGTEDPVNRLAFGLSARRLLPQSRGSA